MSNENLCTSWATSCLYPGIGLHAGFAIRSCRTRNYRHTKRRFQPSHDTLTVQLLLQCYSWCPCSLILLQASHGSVGSIGGFSSTAPVYSATGSSWQRDKALLVATWHPALLPYSMCEQTVRGADIILSTDSNFLDIDTPLHIMNIAHVSPFDPQRRC